MAPEYSSSGVSRFKDRDMGVLRVRCEVGKPLAEQRHIGHNRWHPDIPPVAEVDPAGEVILESPGYDDYQRTHGRAQRLCDPVYAGRHL